jgi:uracil-DNA glycosylase family 4
MYSPIYVCPGKCCADFSGYALQPTYPVVPPAILAIVGEAPGEAEIKVYKFFMGRAGQELTNYLIRVGIPRDRCYLTNLVKCRPPDNRDPTQGEIRACSSILLQELEHVNPRFIATVGRHATQFFLGNVNMEAVHGIPHRVGNRIIIPVYHPAAGLHDTVNMSNIMADFIAVKDTMMGKLEIREVGKTVTPPPYHLIEKGEDPSPYLSDLVAIDTETQDDRDTPWCLQFCCGDQGHIIMWDNAQSLQQFAEWVARPTVLCIIHNSLFDLKVLDIMGVHPARFTDTMIMAYLLQTEPQGLKPLTFRHLNVKMDEYTDIVDPRTQEMALDYIVQAVGVDWPKPDPILEIKAGVVKVKQPQGVNQKVKRILSDLAAGKEIDIYDRWYKMGVEAGRGMVEKRFGVMHRAYLKDVDHDVAMQYAATDPWATYFIYPVLKDKIDTLGLQEVLERDNGVVPMVQDMQQAGMPIYPPYFIKLREVFTKEMEEVTASICNMVGDMHPGSDPQVLGLLEKLNLVRAKRIWVKGKEVVVRKKMTDLKAMEMLRDKHPVIPLLMRYRALAKLVDSFINVLLEKHDENNRVHTTLRITRVVTGRLSSSSPNLMAVPTRTEDGRRIRGGFIAPDGYSFVSNDYSQVEMRIIAHISQDPKMIEVFRTGVDLHTATAAGMFRIPVEEVDEMKHRYPAKRVGFGVLNLISAGKLLQEFQVGGAEGWTEAMCQKVIDDWFNLYRGVKDYVHERTAEARRTGMVRDMFGRVRLSPEVMSVHRSIREAGIRQSVNAPIQQGAQGVIKEAMVQLTPIYKSFGSNIISPLLQIHDDLIFLILDDMIPVVVPIIQDVMENCVALDVPLRVDSKVGKSWEGMKKWKK